jgi:hypothetical protein
MKRLTKLISLSTNISTSLFETFFKRFFLLRNVKTVSAAIQPPVQCIPEFFLGVTQPEHNVNHSPPSSTKVKSEWSCTFTPPICLHGMHRENFTLLSSSKYLQNHTLAAHRNGLVITLKYPILTTTEMYQYIVVKTQN